MKIPRLEKCLNRYVLFDAVVIAVAIAFGVFTGKIVYEARCADTAATADGMSEELARIIPVTEAALAAHQHWHSDQRDTLNHLPNPAPTLTETDDR